MALILANVAAAQVVLGPDRIRAPALWAAAIVPDPIPIRFQSDSNRLPIRFDLASRNVQGPVFQYLGLPMAPFGNQFGLRILKSFASFALVHFSI
jgi:hypothetical protein